MVESRTSDPLFPAGVLQQSALQVSKSEWTQGSRIRLGDPDLVAAAAAAAIVVADADADEWEEGRSRRKK
eukprot:758153-Hanusia_phi.AAC.4